MNHNWECSICHEPLKSPVRCNCGHVFCWRCLCNHMENSLTCPKCDEVLNKDKFIAIYGHGSEDPHLEELPELPNDSKNTSPPPNENQNQNFNTQGNPMPPPRWQRVNRNNLNMNRVYLNIGGFQFVGNNFNDLHQINDDEPVNQGQNGGGNRIHVPRIVITLMFILLFILISFISNDPLI